MKTYNQHSKNAKDLKKAHKELRKLRMQRGNAIHTIPNYDVVIGKEFSYNEYNPEYEEGVIQ